MKRDGKMIDFISFLKLHKLRYVRSRTNVQM